MRHKARFAVGITLALVLGSISTFAHADSSVAKNRFLRISEFEGHIVFCAPQTPPVNVEVLPGGVEIVTFINIGNIWLTGNPLVDGVEENRVVARFDPASPIARAKIKYKIDVAALDGTWIGRQRLTIGPEGVSGIGLGLGLGDLRGKLMIFENEQNQGRVQMILIKDSLGW